MGFKTWHLTTPVLLYSILFNVPKFFEYMTMCPMEYIRSNASSPLTLYDDFSNYYKLNVYLLRNNLTGTGTNTHFPSPPGDEVCGFSEKLLVINNSRDSNLYISLYILGLNSVLNIVIPGVSLICLNISIMSKIREHMKNVEKFLERTETNGRP